MKEPFLAHSDLTGAIYIVDGKYKYEVTEQAKQAVKAVNRAHWIEGQSDDSNIHNILCSHCFEGYPSKGHANSKYTREKFKWCPNCGAYMISEVEK